MARKEKFSGRTACWTTVLPKPANSARTAFYLHVHCNSLSRWRPCPFRIERRNQPNRNSASFIDRWRTVFVTLSCLILLHVSCIFILVQCPVHTYNHVTLQLTTATATQSELSDIIQPLTVWPPNMLPLIRIWCHEASPYNIKFQIRRRFYKHVADVSKKTSSCRTLVFGILLKSILEQRRLWSQSRLWNGICVESTGWQLYLPFFLQSLDSWTWQRHDWFWSSQYTGGQIHYLYHGNAKNCELSLKLSKQKWNGKLQHLNGNCRIYRAWATQNDCCAVGKVLCNTPGAYLSCYAGLV